MNSVCKYLFHKLIDHPERWYPIPAVYCLTYRCHFRCPYCSDGSGKPYYTLRDVYYPCLEIGHSAGNILEISNLHVLRSYGMGRFGPQPSCDVRCHSACALGFALILRYPFSIAREAYHLARKYRKRSRG